jgi:hypothetical protein
LIGYCQFGTRVTENDEKREPKRQLRLGYFFFTSFFWRRLDNKQQD